MRLFSFLPIASTVHKLYCNKHIPNYFFLMMQSKNPSRELPEQSHAMTPIPASRALLSHHRRQMGQI